MKYFVIILFVFMAILLSRGIAIAQIPVESFVGHQTKGNLKYIPVWCRLGFIINREKYF